MPEIKGYKYAYSAKQIGEVFSKIKETGRPEKLTITYMQNTWLLKNAQYGALIDILKDMKFLEDSGAPTNLYAKYQNNSHSNEALEEGIKNLYPDLFKAYPKANEMPKEQLDGFFKQHTGADKSVISKLYTTFNKLCSMTEFQNDNSKLSFDSRQQEKKNTNKDDFKHNTIPITMNIQIVIPSDATSDQYDKIFTSIKNNLIN